MENFHLIKIKNWVFDPTKKTLTFEPANNAENKESKVESLESKHAALLSCLIEHQGTVVSREKLVKLVWKDRFVDDRTINATISRLRKILSSDKQAYIKTHPKLGYSLNCQAVYVPITLPEKITLEQQKPIATRVKLVFICLIVLSLALVWFAIDQSQKSLQNLENSHIEIEPLTYEEGWEFEPSLSKDGKLLAYVSLQDWQSNSQVHVQNNASKNTKPINSSVNTRTPVWNKDSYELYYAAEINNQCIIKKINVSTNLEFSPPKTVISCGNIFDVPHIAISNDGYWLYYLDQNKNEPSKIKRYNLQTQAIEVLTNPPSSLHGDYDIALNSNDSKLVFIRHYDDMSHSALTLNLESGEQLDYTKRKFEVDSVGWSDFEDSFVFTDDAFNTLYTVNTNTLNFTKVFQNDERLSDPIYTVQNEVLISIGDPYKSNVGSIKIINNEFTPINNIINSSFKDHSPVSVQGSINELYFVSNRSGSYELWKQSANSLKQVTYFNSPENYISELLITNNNSTIVFKLNNSYKALDLYTGNIKNLKFNQGEIRSITKNCDSENAILMTVKQSGQWNLINLAIDTFKITSIQKNITSVKANCSKNHYLVTKQGKNGLYKLIGNGITSKKPLLPTFNFSDSGAWSVDGNFLFFWDNSSKQLVSYNFETNNKTMIDLPDKYLTLLSSNNNTLYFSELSVQNTYIGKFTIPNSE
ncbi:winged helix-turn-helix domain-containing protein [Thalassotalea sediminis]|uniref:winged helix-turn-helix domain-containing protein n=1 Tax=Thalassotalea sediminis TaxID=1759089 RepID=UPI002572EC29|nr:winged helix-turn-helix domain-containing protein [Thalassotalea sediminis]